MNRESRHREGVFADNRFRIWKVFFRPLTPSLYAP